MKGRTVILLAVVLTSIILTPHGLPEASAHQVVQVQPDTQPEPPYSSNQVAAAMRSAPLMFIENVGQFDDRARFQVRGSNGTIWLTEDGLWITLLESNPDATNAENPSVHNLESQDQSHQGVNLKVSFGGANPHPRLEPFTRLQTHVSYLIGNDPDKWRPDVPVWGGVRYVNLYPGIDLELTGESGQWQPHIVARPGADLDVVRLQVEGADEIALEDDRLRLTTAVGEFSLPLLQTVTADGSPLPGLGKGPGVTATEITAPFAARNPAVILPDGDPADLLYSTFLGGNAFDIGYDIVVDGAGSTYVTGETYSTDFPTTPGAFDTSIADGDAFVVKINPAESGLVYATFLGGSVNDRGTSIAVDEAGSVYVTGYTSSADFPVTVGAFDTTLDGYSDAYVVKVNPVGSDLVYSTYLGGGSSDYGLGIVVGSLGSAYVTGHTASTNFPTTSGAFDTSFNGVLDAFVVKLALDGGQGGSSYTASGHITDARNNGLANVVISANGALSATTDANGDYTITGLITGTYTLTPALSGYTFEPVSQTVAVPPEQIGQDFTGIISEMDYFALGDSIASGHGLMDDGTDCRRSDRAYVQKMEDFLATRYETVSFPPENFLACSGATALDPGTVEDPNQWLHNQVDSVLANLSDQPTLVSLTIGVNDFGWADYSILFHVAEDPVDYLQWVNETTATVVAAVKSEVERLLFLHPNVVVVLTLQYNPFNTDSFFFDLAFRSCNDIYGVLNCYERTKYLVQGLNNGLILDVFVPLNQTYPNQMGIARTHTLFRDHESPRPFCGSNPPEVVDTWIQYFGDPDSNSLLPPPLRRLWGDPDTTGDCFHPNENGAQAIADAVNAAALQLDR